MYKKYLISFLLFINTFIAFAQEPIYFNNIYNPVNTYASGRGILQVGSLYYGIFGTLETSGYWYNLGVFKMSLSGNLIDWNLIGENGYDYFAGSVGGTLIQTMDGNLAFACHVGNPGPTIGTLVKINLNLDTIWKRDYHIEEQYTMTIKVKQTLYGGYIIVGQVYPGTGNFLDALLIKTDNSGNEVWYNTFGVNSNASEYGTDIIETPDGGYLIGGMKDIEAIDHSLDAMLIKTDSLGNEEWTQYYGNPDVDDDMALVAMAGDGNYLVATVYGVHVVSPTSRTGRIRLIKIDNDGNTIWDKIIGPKERNVYLKNLRHTNDGNLIVAGWAYNDTVSEWVYEGLLYKFSQQGDSIWMRDYNHFNNQYDRNFFYDTYPTSDNGYIAIGKARPDMGGNNKMWIVKVDSMGCDTPGCITTVISEEWMVKGEQGLRVWPNPAKDMVTLSLSKCEAGAGKEKMIRVFNSHGLKVEEIEVPDGLEALTIDVSGYNRGLYFLKLIINGKAIANQKVIIH